MTNGICSFMLNSPSFVNVDTSVTVGLTTAERFNLAAYERGKSVVRIYYFSRALNGADGTQHGLFAVAVDQHLNVLHVDSLSAGRSPPTRQ